MRTRISLLLLVAALLVVVAPRALAETSSDEEPVVHAVFFFSPTCPHCELVIQENLPGMFEEFGGQPTLSYDETGDPIFYLMTNGTLELLIVDASVDAGAVMYTADIARLSIPENRGGVPRVDIGDTYLVGSSEIPEQMPGLVEEGLAAGGVAWPQIPGIREALASIPSAVASPGTVTLPASDTIGDRFATDPLGNSLAVVVLAGLIVSLVAVPMMLARGTLGDGALWMIPLFAAIGTLVSLYLAQVETTGAEAVCGPVGDCKAVQQSAYASILEIPIGVLGVAGYLLLFIAWMVSNTVHGRVALWGAVAAFAIAFGGTAFSVYLTFLEPFVIGATCMWCLTSALCIAGLLWLTAGRGWRALGHIRASDH
jgi:uncharacterized membrane protein